MRQDMSSEGKHHGIALLVLTTAMLACPTQLFADEGGVGFWLPGFYGSLTAVPGEPGPSFATIYYHSSVGGGGNKNFVRGGAIVAGLSGRADVGFFGPTYTFETPVLGGQASIILLGAVGRSTASINATLTGPLGGTLSGSRSDALTGFGDVAPQAALKWNEGVHNFMTYVTGAIPVGSYNANRLVNLGIGHGAIDAGGGYTYFDQATGHEFSATLGFTYNFENTHTSYQNGADLHLDWGASQFLSKQLHIGLVGYLYNQISPDSGAGAKLGSFESRVAGIGPQVGYIFSIGDGAQGYINVKGYKEFGAQNRAAGWNAWVTLSISLTPPRPVAAQYLSLRINND